MDECCQFCQDTHDAGLVSDMFVNLADGGALRWLANRSPKLGQYRIRVWQKTKLDIVIISEMLENIGASVTNGIERIATILNTGYYSKPSSKQRLFVEHYCSGGMPPQPTFDIVSFGKTYHEHGVTVFVEPIWKPQTLDGILELIRPDPTNIHMLKPLRPTLDLF